MKGKKICLIKIWNFNDFHNLLTNLNAKIAGLSFFYAIYSQNIVYVTAQ